MAIAGRHPERRAVDNSQKKIESYSHDVKTVVRRRAATKGPNRMIKGKTRNQSGMNQFQDPPSPNHAAFAPRKWLFFAAYMGTKGFSPSINYPASRPNWTNFG
jgi:hypothetical protein